MYRTKIKLFAILILAPFFLTACENAKEELGLTRQAPDEFAVVRRAPLSLPPEYELRPPEPGAARPQEISPEDQAKQTVFGGDTIRTNSTPTNSEEFLLEKTGGNRAPEDIRRVIDNETASMEKRDVPVAKKILNLGGDDEPAQASVVDANAEAERIRKNIEEGKPITDGQTPSIVE
jgi:hypothetical protein